MTALQAAVLARQRRESGQVRLITGHFDPVLAAHARPLVELASGAALFVALAEPPAPLLPARARAELVAALRVVDYVVLPDAAEWQPLLDAFEPGEIFHDEPRHDAIARDFNAHVRRRNQLG